MKNNYETLRMPELKALARERKLRLFSIEKSGVNSFSPRRRQMTKGTSHPRTGNGSSAVFNQKTTKA